VPNNLTTLSKDFKDATKLQYKIYNQINKIKKGEKFSNKQDNFVTKLESKYNGDRGGITPMMLHIRNLLAEKNISNKKVDSNKQISILDIEVPRSNDRLSSHQKDYSYLNIVHIDVNQNEVSENQPMVPVKKSSDDNKSLAKSIVEGYFYKRKNNDLVITKDTVSLLKDLLGGYKELISSLDDMFVHLKNNDPVKKYFDELFSEIKDQKTQVEENEWALLINNEDEEECSLLDGFILSDSEHKKLTELSKGYEGGISKINNPNGLIDDGTKSNLKEFVLDKDQLKDY